MSMTVTALGFAVYMDSVAAFIKKILTKVRNVLEAVFYYVKLPWEGLVSFLVLKGYLLFSLFLSYFFLIILSQHAASKSSVS